MMITFYTLEEAKAYAKKLLEETDYALLSDVNLTNKNDFVFYRNLIRILYISPRVTAWWPEKPQAIWGEPSNSPITEANQPNTNLPTE
jgi:hypothetical protein